LRKQIAAAEREVDRITQKISALDHTLSEPGIYEREPARAQMLLKDRGTLAKALGEAEMLWLQLSEDYERARLVQSDAGAA
jgi:ATP-binding cassette subfamily F protein 3